MSFVFVAPTDAPCVMVQLGDLALDQVTPDPDGIQWGVEMLEGWWDTPSVRVEQAEVPTGSLITVVRQNARALVLTAFAFLPSSGIGNLAFAALSRMKATVRPALTVAIPLSVVDPARTHTASVRLAGAVQSEIIGNLQLVRFQVPLSASNPVLVQV